MDEFCRGYIARSVWHWPSWGNPWPLGIWPQQHCTWAEGWDEAHDDLTRQAPPRRLEPEYTRISGGAGDRLD